MAFEAFVLSKILHVFFAVAWLGGVLHFLVVTQPILMRQPRPAQGAINRELVPINFRYGNITGGLTLLTGLLLIQLNPYGYSWGTMGQDTWGRLVLFGLIATLAMLYLLNFALKPTMKILGQRMMELGTEEEIPQGLKVLMGRVTFTARLILIIGLTVLVAMVVANSSGLLGI